ncbi:hypothetical protein [Sneathiella sp.]|uniref:hypothetical protein n=1 Tax=Sneathiella sp. TaxID=1964365 RepID=UPI003562E256
MAKKHSTEEGLVEWNQIAVTRRQNNKMNALDSHVPSDYEVAARAAFPLTRARVAQG